jgi:hypothetical protein
MKSILNKKLRGKPELQFIVLNEHAQVYCGLKGGYPQFSDNFSEARSIERDEQLNTIQRGTLFKLEKILSVEGIERLKKEFVYYSINLKKEKLCFGFCS